MNQLAAETSPYLLQHAQNPVHWHAWRAEAFARAKAENKPILVSIGYSTCHWCHVMERESFENEETAALMNAHFVCIKVDREERPDLDQIYMDACQIQNSSGGWPLNCFLLPDGRPFFSGTYWPPRPAFNRPAWSQVLLHIHQIWTEKRAMAEEQAERLMVAMARISMPPTAQKTTESNDFFQKTNDLTGRVTDLGRIFYALSEDFDTRDGGFGTAPKFPSTMALRWLMAWQHYSKNEAALEHALFSLEKMICGGIYDQLGGGFARYATDSAWLAPHFEKMLYDNALLLSTLADALKISGLPIFREAIEQTFEWITREMTDVSGGFYSAQDADSEGVEGKFFVWEKSEIEQILGGDAPVFCQFYDVSEGGNWEETNILNQPVAFDIFCETAGFEPNLLKKKLEKCRKQLFEVRSTRIWPGKDDKIILGWNALMTSGLAHAFEATGDEKIRAAAERNLDFLLTKMPDFHTYKNGVGQYQPFVDDLAFLIAATLDVAEISQKNDLIKTAENLTNRVLKDFFDEKSGLFYFACDQQTDLIMRRFDLSDNATPSGNSVMVHNLQRLGLLLDRPDWLKIASSMLETMASRFEKHPLAYSEWARGWLFEKIGRSEIVVVGKAAFENARQIGQKYLPGRLILASEFGNENLSLLAGRAAMGDETLIYLCENQSCRLPVSTVDELLGMIG